jgi:hypothetical protein
MTDKIRETMWMNSKSKRNQTHVGVGDLAQ